MNIGETFRQKSGNVSSPMSAGAALSQYERRNGAGQRRKGPASEPISRARLRPPALCGDRHRFHTIAHPWNRPRQLMFFIFHSSIIGHVR